MLVDRDAARLEEAAKAVAETGAEVRVRTADVASSADVRGYVADAVDAFGTIDVLFNNAGIIGPVGALAEYDEDAFDRIMAINVRGVFLGLRHVLPIMIVQGSGAVINTGSLSSERGLPGTPAYNAAKHAVLGLTRSAASEVAPAGVRVNAVLPGMIDTPMLAEVTSGFDDAAAARARRRGSPRRAGSGRRRRSRRSSCSSRRTRRASSTASAGRSTAASSARSRPRSRHEHARRARRAHGGLPRGARAQRPGGTARSHRASGRRRTGRSSTSATGCGGPRRASRTTTTPTWPTTAASRSAGSA